VAVLIVPGFIASLNVAVITLVLAEVTVEPSGGVTEVTRGGVSGLPPFALLPKPLHPAARATSRNATNGIFQDLNSRIGFRRSTCDKGFLSTPWPP
jgi:hypothetical protein